MSPWLVARNTRAINLPRGMRCIVYHANRSHTHTNYAHTHVKTQTPMPLSLRCAWQRSIRLSVGSIRTIPCPVKSAAGNVFFCVRLVHERPLVPIPSRESTAVLLATIL